MREIHLFCEDVGQERFVKAMLERFAVEYGVELRVTVWSARGGVGRMINRLQSYVAELEKVGGHVHIPDLIVVARDANCQGMAKTKKEVEGILGRYIDFTVLAVPNPHVERWHLVDSSAFSQVLGTGCSAPDEKCEKERYKKLLVDAVLKAGVTPLIGGLEHTEDLVKAIDLDRMTTADESLGAFISELRQRFRAWSRQEK
ncbi:MAG: hypothetical protein R3247_01805 [Rhodothermales bacterium]|nr:hypothetical protein [Rhodothermales bacterium]